eukprot:365069-Chlamydomonas_euryale.AAC.22
MAARPGSGKGGPKAPALKRCGNRPQVEKGERELGLEDSEHREGARRGSAERECGEGAGKKEWKKEWKEEWKKTPQGVGRVIVSCDAALCWTCCFVFEAVAWCGQDSRGLEALAFVFLLHAAAEALAVVGRPLQSPTHARCWRPGDGTAPPTVQQRQASEGQLAFLPGSHTSALKMATVAPRVCRESVWHASPLPCPPCAGERYESQAVHFTIPCRLCSYSERVSAVAAGSAGAAGAAASAHVHVHRACLGMKDACH